MENPIPQRVRGWLYIIGIIVGGFTAPIELIAKVYWGADGGQLATILVSSVLLVLAMLARANLRSPDEIKED